MKYLLLLALIALFFKAYAIEADIGLLVFYLHLPNQDPEGVRFVWDELAKTPLMDIVMHELIWFYELLYYYFFLGKLVVVDEEIIFY